MTSKGEGDRAEVAMRLLCDTDYQPITYPITYEPNSRQDFGGENSLRLHLRKYPFPGIVKAKLETDFGVFLGHHYGIGWVVGIKSMPFAAGPGLSDWVAYTTLGELKQNWELD